MLVPRVRPLFSSALLPFREGTTILQTKEGEGNHPEGECAVGLHYYSSIESMNDRLGDLFGTENGEIPSWALEEEEKVTVKPSPSLEEDDNNDPKKKKRKAKKQEDEVEGDVESGMQQQQQQQPKYMESFFNDVDMIKSDVDAIREATKRVGEINEEALKATTTSKEEELSRMLKPLIDKTNKRAKRTKNLLALLKEDNMKFAKEVKAATPGGISQSDLR